MTPPGSWPHHRSRCAATCAASFFLPHPPAEKAGGLWRVDRHAPFLWDTCKGQPYRVTSSSRAEKLFPSGPIGGNTGIVTLLSRGLFKVGLFVLGAYGEDGLFASRRLSATVGDLDWGLTLSGRRKHGITNLTPRDVSSLSHKVLVLRRCDLSSILKWALCLHRRNDHAIPPLRIRRYAPLRTLDDSPTFLGATTTTTRPPATRKEPLTCP